MIWIDYAIFLAYFIVLWLVGYKFYLSNKDQEDYYVGGRQMSSWHVGLSVVATDVGGGFSIGLGGLGFAMGIAGSWMLFTGLIGAWMAAVLLIPKVHSDASRLGLFTFPQFLSTHFNSRVAWIAGLISAIGYIGFTSSQLLAGAKLAQAAFPDVNLVTALIVMGILAVGYTVIGGLKAVIYTDTIQWMILMVGLIAIGIPLGYNFVGGIEGIQKSVPAGHLSLTNLHWVDMVNWTITIVPIWFIGMTLYQRIYACGSVKEAQKAWYLAGLLEYPVMAFMGVILGLFSRAALDQGAFEHLGYASGMAMDAELGLPLLLRTMLPYGLTGLMLAAYFSAIMSTADSCLMAASGNIVTDLSPKKDENDSTPFSIKYAQIITLIIGSVSVILAATMTNVLDLMLHSYAFMVSGLIVPVLAALWDKRPSVKGAIVSMVSGGSLTLFLTIYPDLLNSKFDPILFGIGLGGITYILTKFASGSHGNTNR